MASFKYGANFKITGKADPQKLSYAGAWQSTQGSFAELAGHIGQGHPWMPALLDGNGKRWQSNANYAEIIGADHDHGLSIIDALNHPFIAAHAGLLIESSSSTPEHNKFRTVYRLPRPVTDWQTLKVCNRYLIEKLGTADPACKDASRFFFGAPGKSPKLLNEVATLPQSFIEDALAWADALEAQQQLEAAEKAAKWAQWKAQNPSDSGDIVKDALGYIAPYSPGQGRYSKLVAMIGGVLAELGFEGESLLRDWDGGRGEWGRGGFDRILKSLTSSHSSNKASLGTLFYLAKQSGFNFPASYSPSRPMVGSSTAKAGHWQDLAERLDITIPNDDGEARKAINTALAATQMLGGESIEGYFDPLDIPNNGRWLYLLDGQKCTGKTSNALRSVVTQAKKNAQTVMVVAETRILAIALSKDLGIPYATGDESENLESNQIVICPESAWKFADRDFDIFIADEANVDLERAFSGSLGNFPEKSRNTLISIIKKARISILSHDGLYRPVINAVQRIGGFAPNEIKVIRRRRPHTDIAIKLYLDSPGETESYDGLEPKKIKANDAFYCWFDAIVEAVKSGQKVSIPCGSQGKARRISRMLSRIFPDKKIRCVDGQNSFSSIKKRIALERTGYLKSENIDVFIYTPVFNGGVSLDGEYFDIQFEYIYPSENATSASQRGERVRDAIYGSRIQERHIYLSNRGLPNSPDHELFFPEYWENLAKSSIDGEYQAGAGMAKLLGCHGALEISKNIAKDRLRDYHELFSIYAIKARETYFKQEILRDEWESNGWDISDVELDPSKGKGWRELDDEITEGITGTKARAFAKANPKNSMGAEPAGPIERIKFEKFDLSEKVGRDNPILNNPEALAAWLFETGKSGGIPAMRIQALIHLAINDATKYQEIKKILELRLVSKAMMPDAENLEIPVNPSEFYTADLIFNCPGVVELVNGELERWDKDTALIKKAAAYTRERSTALSRISRHEQRIYGLQFTETTPDIKCFHKLIQLAGFEAISAGRAATAPRLYQYHLATADALKIALEAATKQSKHEARELRRIYRLETQQALVERIELVMRDRLSSCSDAWENRFMALKDIPELEPDQRRLELQLPSGGVTEVLDGINIYRCPYLEQPVKVALELSNGRVVVEAIDSSRRSVACHLSELTPWAPSPTDQSPPSPPSPPELPIAVAPVGVPIEF